MLQWSIIIIFFSVTAVRFHEIAPFISPNANYDNQQDSKLQNGLKANGNHKILKETDQTDAVWKTTESEVLGTKTNAGESGLTLEKCFGGLGRWLSLSSDKKNETTKKPKSCYKCCMIRRNAELSRAPEMSVTRCKECCARVLAGDCDECSKILIDGAGEMTGDAGDPKLILQRLVNTGTEAGRGFTVRPNLGAVSRTMRQHGGKDSKKRRSSSRRPKKKPSWVENDCCDGGLCCKCAQFFEDCCICMLIGPLWLIKQCGRGCEELFCGNWGICWFCCEKWIVKRF